MSDMHIGRGAMEAEDVGGGEKRETAAEQGTKTGNSVFLPEGAGQATRDTACCKAHTSLKQADSSHKSIVAAFPVLLELRKNQNVAIKKLVMETLENLSNIAERVSLPHKVVLQTNRYRGVSPKVARKHFLFAFTRQLTQSHLTSLRQGGNGALCLDGGGDGISFTRNQTKNNTTTVLDSWTGFYKTYGLCTSHHSMQKPAIALCRNVENITKFILGKTLMETQVVKAGTNCLLQPISSKMKLQAGFFFCSAREETLCYWNMLLFEE